MRALNVFLCFAVSALLGLCVLEMGLRALGRGPQPTINRFDPVTGWSKTPNSTGHRRTSEFDVRYDINAFGLRDDPMTSAAKPDGTLRVLMLGDSFVLGYTVDRSDLFVDLLEDWWKREGRRVDVVNAGTEGFSTDQEVAWLEQNGAAFQPDVVVLFPYENDLYWNGETHYRRFPKPRYTAFGDREHLVLQDPGPRPWYEKTALGALWALLHEPRSSWTPDGKHVLAREDAATFKEPPREFMTDAIARTRGALVALQAHCAKLGARLCIAPIPSRECIDESALRDKQRAWAVDPALWSPDEPVDLFLELARGLGLETVDARSALRAEAAAGERLYFRSDFHLNAHGNRAFAQYLHDALDRAHVFPPAFAATRPAACARAAEPAGIPRWIAWFAGLWLVLTTLYALTYRDEPWWKAALGVAGMLALVFGIATGASALLQLVPPNIAPFVTLLVVATILSFVAFKLGRRAGTIVELLVAFTRRGHWYLMPLVVVLLSVGSLLVIAASSPLIAPFIYTLF